MYKYINPKPEFFCSFELTPTPWLADSVNCTHSYIYNSVRQNVHIPPFNSLSLLLNRNSSRRVHYHLLIEMIHTNAKQLRHNAVALMGELPRSKYLARSLGGYIHVQYRWIGKCFSGDAMPVSVCVNTILTHAIRYLRLASNLRIQSQIFLRRNSVCLTRYSLRPACGRADLINWKPNSVNLLNQAGRGLLR